MIVDCSSIGMLQAGEKIVGDPCCGHDLDPQEELATCRLISAFGICSHYQM